MTYGYFNAYITDMNEDVVEEVNLLRNYAELIVMDSLSYRPNLNTLIDEQLKVGDTLYVYSFKRFCSGLRDLDCLFTELIQEKKVNVISLTDDFDSTTAEGKGACLAFHQATDLMSADPSYGFYR